MKKILFLLFAVVMFAACKKDNKSDPTLYFTTNTHAVGDADYTLRPPLSTSSGDFSYTSSDLSVATISGNTVSVKKTGTTTISATQSASEDYGPATITATLTIVPAGTFVVGQAIPGGIVVYVNGTGQHGYMTSADDIGTNVPWSTGNVNATVATSTGLGTGNANTAKIIALIGNSGTYAAKMCVDYRGGGFTDWYLPSLAEMAFMRYSRDLIGLPQTNYWTSNEVAATPTSPNAYFMYMGMTPTITALNTASNATVININGTTFATSISFQNFSKLYTFSVRPLRAF
jgi:hypothetical protein